MAMAKRAHGAAMRNAVLALYGYLLFFAIVLAWLPLMAAGFLATLPFDRNRVIIGRGLRIVASLVGAVCPLWDLRAEGAEHRPHGPFVAIANHESILDVLLIPRVPWEMKWVAKASLFKVPFIGWMLRMSGDIPVVRGDSDSHSEALAKARRWLDRGMPVMFFPEGTRSHTDELRPFKLGAFRLAIAAGVPVLPIAVYGTRGGMPVGSPWVRRTKALARVLPAEPTAGMTQDDAPQLAARMRERLTAERAAIAAELGSCTGEPEPAAATR